MAPSSPSERVILESRKEGRKNEGVFKKAGRQEGRQKGRQTVRKEGKQHVVGEGKPWH
jgi:hypothetical protein